MGDAGKAAGPHRFHPFFLPGELQDRGWEIAVGRPVPGNQPSDEREHGAEIEVVQPAQNLVGRDGQFEYDEPPSGLEDAEDFLQGLFPVFEIPYSEGYGCAVEGGIFETHLLAVALLHQDSAAKPRLADFFFHYGEHSFGEVHPRYDGPGMSLAGYCYAEIPGPAGYVENLLGLGTYDMLYRTAAPAAVHSEREQMVETVVVAGDGIEQRLYPVCIRTFQDFRNLKGGTDTSDKHSLDSEADF